MTLGFLTPNLGNFLLRMGGFVELWISLSSLCIYDYLGTYVWNKTVWLKNRSRITLDLMCKGNNEKIRKNWQLLSIASELFLSVPFLGNHCEKWRRCCYGLFCCFSNTFTRQKNLRVFKNEVLAAALQLKAGWSGSSTVSPVEIGI